MVGKDHFTLYKRGKIWCYCCYSNGKRYRRSTGETTKLRALDEIQRRIRDNDLLLTRKKIQSKLVRDYFEPFFDYDRCPLVQDKRERGGHVSVEGCKNNRNNMRKFVIPELGSKSMQELTPEICNKFLRKMPEKYGIKPQTANKVFIAFRQVLEYAVQEGVISSNPARGIKQLISKPEPRGCFTSSQIKMLFSDHWDDYIVEWMCKLSALTGMRQGEILALSNEQLHDDYITVDRAYARGEGRKSPKSGKVRTVPVLPEIINELRRMPSKGDFVFSITGKKVDIKTIANVLNRRMEKCGIDYKAEKLSFHSFRHFFNTRLVASGLQGEQVRAVIGHESEEMTEHYLHLSAEDLKQVLDVQNSILN